MSKHLDRELERQKKVFAWDNKEFISFYELIHKGQMTKTKLKSAMGIGVKKFKELETEYLRLFYGKE